LPAQAAAPECICEIVTSRAMTREVRWRRFAPTGLPRADEVLKLKSATEKILRQKFCVRNFAPRNLEPKLSRAFAPA
jgi:hypothetical protein